MDTRNQDVTAQAANAAMNRLLDAPIEKVIIAFVGRRPTKLPEEIGECKTLRTLLANPYPPLNLLRFMMVCIEASPPDSNACPSVVKEVAYYACLAVAMARCGWSSPDLSNDQLKFAFEKGMQLRWADEDIQSLFDEGLAAIFSAERAAAEAAVQRPTMSSVLADLPAAVDAAIGENKLFALWRSPVFRGVATGILLVLMVIPLACQIMPSRDLETPDLEGYHDLPYGAASVSGWAWDLNTPNAPISVDINDGTHKVTVVADVYREDLRLEGKGNGKHGFVFEIPRDWRDGRTYSVWVTVAGTQRILGDTPRDVTYKR